MMWKLNKEKNLGLDKRFMNHIAYAMVRDNRYLFETCFDEETVKKPQTTLKFSKEVAQVMSDSKTLIH